MESVITRIVLSDGAESEWEAAMRDRMTRAAWEQWHEDPAFRDTAERLEGLETDPGAPTWHTVVYAGGRFEAG
jgi:hypothetical protein